MVAESLFWLHFQCQVSVTNISKLSPSKTFPKIHHFQAYILRAALHDFVAVFHWPQQISFILFLSMSIFATLLISGCLLWILFFKCFTFEKLSLSTQSITFHRKSRNLSVLNFVPLNWSGYFDGHSLTDCSAFHDEACSAQHRCFVVHMLSIKYGCSFQCSNIV